ncbi:hypothetical protein L596_011990 [Steinernema carpocapsae]|uniref:Uncharacterized protein n=1 Tax=Steinernema carpocapsae TaxID=34508 RepID=A0A4U5NVR7_STECR|nr:hypothetical protein L596_011990 [Steinernema carpocapsae]
MHPVHLATSAAVTPNPSENRHPKHTEPTQRACKNARIPRKASKKRKERRRWQLAANSSRLAQIEQLLP